MAVPALAVTVLAAIASESPVPANLRHISFSFNSAKPK